MTTVSFLSLSARLLPLSRLIYSAILQVAVLRRLKATWLSSVSTRLRWHLFMALLFDCSHLFRTPLRPWYTHQFAKYDLYLLFWLQIWKRKCLALSPASCSFLSSAFADLLLIDDYICSVRWGISKIPSWSSYSAKDLYCTAGIDWSKLTAPTDAGRAAPHRLCSVRAVFGVYYNPKVKQKVPSSIPHQV